MVKNSSVWDSELKISTDSKCPHCTEAKIEINFPELIWKRVLRLTKELDTEWLGYLKATKEKTEEGIKWNVTELFIPQQEVTATNATPSETPHAQGVIHSHANCGATFSPTDDEYANANHDFSVMLNKAENCTAVAKVQMPCKAQSMVEAKVFVEDTPAQADLWIDEAKKNITKKVYQQPLLYQKKWNYLQREDGLYDDGPPVISSDNCPKGPAHTEPNFHYYDITYAIPNLADETKKDIAKLAIVLNSGRLSKKNRKATVRKLAELGATATRRNGMVTIKLPGLELGDFLIEGTMELGEKLAIGYFCTDCHSFANIKDLDKLIVTNPKNNMTECITCGGCVAPILIDDIAKPEEQLTQTEDIPAVF